MILRQETQLATLGSSQDSLNRYWVRQNKYKTSSHNQGTVMYQNNHIRAPVHQTMKHKHVHQTNMTVSDPINSYSARPVLELTLVHEAYKLASSQEPVTTKMPWKGCNSHHCRPWMLTSSSVPTLLHNYYRAQNSETILGQCLQMVRNSYKDH